MISSSLRDKLSRIDSFEKYEQFKLNIDSLTEIAQAVVSRHQLPVGSLALFSDGTNIVFS